MQAINNGSRYRVMPGQIRQNNSFSRTTLLNHEKAMGKQAKAIILREGFETPTFFEERELVEFSDANSNISVYLTEHTEPEKGPWELNIEYPSDVWLDAIGKVFLLAELPSGGSLGKHPPPNAEDVVKWLILRKHEMLEHLMLDSFSVVENGETARKYDRTIERSPLQDAILKLVQSKKIDLREAFSPRAFEVLVAHALRSIGFERVELKRYSKDGGIDIYAVIAERETIETVIVEVKHWKDVCGLSVLDRLNGVRDRDSASRAILVCSGTVSRDAIQAYEAKSAIVAACTFADLAALMKDTGDWAVTPSGLWTKKK